MKALAVSIVGLFAIFIVSFASAKTVFLVLPPAIAIVTAFLAARSASTITRSWLTGAVTGWLAVVSFTYGIFVAYEVGWRDLDIKEWTRWSHDGVAGDIGFAIFYGGFLAALIGSVIGLLAYTSKPDKPRW